MISDGVINIYKEKGYTSHDVVAIIKKQLKVKAGHTGTLDPDAEGVLPVCIGRATKLADYITAGVKGYKAVMRLGVSTDTQDMTGNIIYEKDVNLSPDEIRKVIMAYVGDIAQIPPMYSAIKINGEKLYNLARKGIEIERKSRLVTIYNMDILSIGKDTAEMNITCSKGTYIRTLCCDIGEKLGVGGAMESLLRTRTGDFMIQDSIRLGELLGCRDNGTLDKCIIAADDVLSEYDKVYAKEQANCYIKNGNKISSKLVTDSSELEDSAKYRLYNNGNRFIGLYIYNGDGFLKPQIILTDLSKV